MKIRAYTPEDATLLYAVFSSAVHGIASADYSPEQIAAWAPSSIDMIAWTERMTRLHPLVVEHNGTPVAYAALLSNGCIDDFYVAAAFARQGVGTILMQEILVNASRNGLTELYSDVSVTAQAFFSRFGFHIVEQRMPVVRGVAMPNARMAKSLAADQPLHPTLRASAQRG
jgi:putative acetyltransferase